MKKLYLFLSSLLLLSFFSGAANAQINNVGQKLTSPDELEDGKAYAIKAVGASAQGFLYENAVNNSVYVNGGVADLTALPAEESNCYIFIAEKKHSDFFEEDFWVFKANSGLYLPGAGTNGNIVVASSEYPFFTEIKKETGTTGFSVCVYDAATWNEWYWDAIRPYTGNPFLGCHMGNNGSTDSPTINGYFEIYPLNDESLKTVVVSYNLKVGDETKTFKTENMFVREGDVINAPEFSLMKLDASSSSSYAVTAETTMVGFVYTEDLPFITSESYDAAKWYAIDMYSEYKSFMWKFNGENEQLLTPVTAYVNPYGVSDSLLWCFVGNMADGFKIYNKQAGPGATLTYGTDYPVLTTDASNNRWGVTAGTYDNSASFYPLGDESRLMRFTSEKISYGTMVGGVTSCRFIPRTTFVYNFLKMCYHASVNTGYHHALGASSWIRNKAYAGRVWGVIRDYETRVEARFTESADMRNLADLCLSDYIPAVVQDNGTYIFFNAGAAGCITVGATKDDAITLANDIATAQAAVPSIVLMEPAGNGSYYLKVQGAYLSADGTKMVDNKSEAAVVEVKHEGEAIFTIKSVGQSVLRYYSVMDGVLGATTTRNAGGEWYVLPAESLTLNLGKSYGTPAMTYATRCFPFAVQLPETGLKAYVATGETETTILLQAIKANEEGNVVIPAKTPVMLHGVLAEETLTILGDDTSTYTDANGFVGSLFKELCPADVAAYVLNYKAGEEVPMFYLLSEDTGKRMLGLNRAYYKSDGTLQTSFSMKFNDRLSGIGEVETENTSADGDKVYYDLNGRRVLYPVQGIYVTKSGKKVYLK